MRSAVRTASRRRPTARPALLAAAAAAGLALAGCGGGKPAQLPPKSSALSVPPAAAASPPADPQQMVIAAYTAYFPASKQAQAASSAAAAQHVLAPYAAQPYLSSVVAQMAAYRQRGETAWGYVTPHVMRVTVSGATAEVYDCQNASHAALASSSTGAEIPGTTGSAATYLIASLSRGSDGRWRLTSLSHLSLSCQPGPAQPS